MAEWILCNSGRISDCVAATKQALRLVRHCCQPPTDNYHAVHYEVNSEPAIFASSRGKNLQESRTSAEQAVDSSKRALRLQVDGKLPSTHEVSALIFMKKKSYEAPSHTNSFLHNTTCKSLHACILPRSSQTPRIFQ